MLETLLVTAQELATFQRREITALDDDDYAETMLSQAQGALERYLGYDPFAHPVTRFRPYWSTETLPSSFIPWEAGSQGPPIVEVDATDYESTPGYYTVSISNDLFSLEVSNANPLPPVVDLFAGWRASNHTLDGAGETIDLTSLSGLATLATLPPETPDVMKRALCNAAVYFARYAVKVGLTSYSVDLGAQVKQVETLTDLPTEMLAIFRQCQRYRRYGV